MNECNKLFSEIESVLFPIKTIKLLSANQKMIKIKNDKKS